MQITIQANLHIVQYLDVEFNLKNDSFKPYIKPGDTPLYVHVNSNHPPSIKRNIPEAINRRLSNLSSDEDQFKSVAPVYQEALEKSGYKFKLKYKPQKPKMKKNKNRKRHQVVWWNPPYSENVKTRVGKIFFKLLETHFPTGHPLRKVINKNTVKMSYRTTPNMKKIIGAHNSKILNQKNQDPPCNCRKKEECPRPQNGSCRSKNVVYQATVTTHQNPPEVETYTGMTATQFKDRYKNHQQTFENESKKGQTTLGQHIWHLKNQNIKYDINWKIIGRAKPFNPVTGVCALCTLEKFFILTSESGATLNRNYEIYKPCIHRIHLLLDKT